MSARHLDWLLIAICEIWNIGFMHHKKLTIHIIFDENICTCLFYSVCVTNTDSYVFNNVVHFGTGTSSLSVC